MANTYTQIHLQCVFAVKYRLSLIKDEWENRLHNYITAIVQNNKHKMLCINSAYDHIHFLIGFRPHQSLADLMRMVKSDSSAWINEENLCTHQFNWQEGYGAFSYTKADVPMVCSYIQNQKIHHHKTSFSTEYKKLLQDFEIDFDDNYLFTTPV